MYSVHEAGASAVPLLTIVTSKENGVLYKTTVGLVVMDWMVRLDKEGAAGGCGDGGGATMPKDAAQLLEAPALFVAVSVIPKFCPEKFEGIVA